MKRSVDLQYLLTVSDIYYVDEFLKRKIKERKPSISTFFFKRTRNQAPRIQVAKIAQFLLIFYCSLMGKISAQLYSEINAVSF